MSAAPIIHCHGPAADQAYARHRALAIALREDPTLRDDPQFTIMRQDAYEQFHSAFVTDGGAR